MLIFRFICRPRDIRVTKILLMGVLIAIWFPAANALEITLPKVALENVPTDIDVTSAEPGSGVRLEIFGQQVYSMADANGYAQFADVVFTGVGTSEILATASGDSVTEKLRILPGWV